MQKLKDIRESCMLGMPIALALIAQLGISFTDVVLITRLGEDESAAVSLALGIFSLAMVFCLGIVTVFSPKYAMEFAKEIKNEKALSTLFINGIWVSAITSLVAVSILICTPIILELNNFNSNIIAMAFEYNLAAAPGLVAFLVYINIRCLLNGIARAKLTTKAMWAALPLNFVISYVLIFGFYDEPFLGVLGAGLASSIVRILILIHVSYFMLKDPIIRGLLPLHGLSLKPSKELLIFALTIGTPIGFRLLFSEGYLPILSFFVGKLGDLQLVIHSISLRVEAILAVFAIGFSGAITTLVAWAIERNSKEEFYNKVMVVFFVVMLYAFIAFIVIKLSDDWLITNLFNLKGETAVFLFTSISTYICLYLVIDCLITLSNGILVGMSDTFYPMIFNMIGYWIVTTGLIIITTKLGNSNVIDVWVALCIGSCSVFTFNILRIHKLVKLTFNK